MLMTLKFNVQIMYDAFDKTPAIFNSVNTDNMYYPEHDTKTKIKLVHDIMNIDINSPYIQHIRANLNSTLRLIQASFNALEAIKIYEK